MTVETFRSVISVQDVDETSLALPWGNTFLPGQQRVLEQVHTIKRRKSRYSRSGSESLSPTSPPSFKTGENFFWRESASRLAHCIAQSKVRRCTSTSSQWDQVQSPDGPPRGRIDRFKSSSSNPELTPASWGQHPQTRFPPNRFGSGMFKESKPKDGISGLGSITMKEAVQYLSRKDENYQNFGASFIQHSTFNDDKAKREVLRLEGIPALIRLLQSPSPLVQQTASGALRNLVFRDADNKLEVQRGGGIGKAVKLLKHTESTETQKHLTGLLWNLSSMEDAKPELLQSALPILVESVIVPFASCLEQGVCNDVDPDSFNHATGCLRNLSSAKQINRHAMRNCRGLIDSLVSYVQSCVAADRPDDKSVENCVCILHNLTYQLETEAPVHFGKINALARSTSASKVQATSSSLGCFSPQGSKIELENHFDYPVMEDNNPKGLGWLFHSKTMQTYLSLLKMSQKDSAVEACVGALQNLTSHNGTVSNVMGQTIVQKLNGLPHIAPLLKSTNPSLQKTAVALVGNLSRSPGLQSIVARQTLPQLMSLLVSGTQMGGDSDETMAMACHTVSNLLKAEPKVGKGLLNDGFVNSLVNLSRNSSFPKSNKAAALLLYGLWAEKDFQSFLKKKGMQKDSFVNDITKSAHKSIQVIQ